jgi:long-chain alkane monooxygenase
MPRTMHFAQYLMHSPTYHSIAMWRHPRTDRTLDWRRPEFVSLVVPVLQGRGRLRSEYRGQTLRAILREEA